MRILFTILFSVISITCLYCQKGNEFDQIIKLKDSLDNIYEKSYGDLGYSNFTYKIIDQDRKKIIDFFNTKTSSYSLYGEQKRLVKGVNIQTDNDLFAVYKNRDEEYTGGLRIEILSDYFNINLLSWRKAQDFLSYNSVYFGFETYTPSVLDIQNESQLNPLDRPFASFQYLGRSRNLIGFRGKKRIRSDIRIGIIGGNIGRNFQMIIHNDITPRAQINRGWDYQIGNGGRFALQYDLMYEWQKEFNGIYFTYGAGGGVGWERIYFTPRISLSNKSFLEKNHHQIIHVNRFFSTQSFANQFKETFYYDFSFNLDMIYRNWMLQGYPYLNRLNVIGNNENLDFVPTISDINHFVGKISLALGFRNNNSSISYTMSLLTPEYDYSWKDKQFHLFARLKIVYDLENDDF